MSRSLQVSSEELQARIRQRTLDLLATKECCVICLESIHEPCEARPCQHRQFDYICLTQWLSHSQRCPLCVQVITEVQHRVSGKDEIDSIGAPQPNKVAPPRPDIAPQPTSVEALYLRDRPRPHWRQRHREHVSQSVPFVGLGLEGRKAVYRQNLFSKHVGSNRLSQYTELTPALFERDEHLVSRARMWLRRELQVFSFLRGPQYDPSSSEQSSESNAHVEFLKQYIIAILKSVDLAGGQAEDMLTDFLGRENTRLFLHELRAWLRSPYTKLEDWDRAVQYDFPLRSESGSGEGSSSSAETSRRRQGDFYRPNNRPRRSLRKHPYAKSDRGNSSSKEDG